jgi:hypothetical protein
MLGMLVGERVRPRTWTAMGIAIGGFAVMAGAPSRPSRPDLTIPGQR